MLYSIQNEKNEQLLVSVHVVRRYSSNKHYRIKESMGWDGIGCEWIVLNKMG